MTDDNKPVVSQSIPDNAQQAKAAPKPQLHISMLLTFAKCPTRGKRQYGYRFGIHDREEVFPPNPDLMTGTIVHRVAETLYNLRLKSSESEFLTVAGAGKLAQEMAEQTWDEGLMLDEEESLNLDATRAAFLLKTKSLAELHARDIAPNRKPCLVEERWVLELPNRDFDLAGTFDLIEEWGVVADLKTKGQTPSGDPAANVQFDMYAAAFEIIYATCADCGWVYQQAQHAHCPRCKSTNKIVGLPKRMQMDCLIWSDRSSTGKVAVFEAVPDRTRIARLWARIDNFAQMLKLAQDGNFVFSGADPDHPWACKRAFCPLWNTCDFWSGK